MLAQMIHMIGGSACLIRMHLDEDPLPFACRIENAGEAFFNQ
jgi:hypothetical protein